MDCCKAHFCYPFLGAVVVVWQLDLQLPVQSVHITTKVVSSNPVQGEVYSMQHYVIKFVSDLRQLGGFLRVLRFPPPTNLTATICTRHKPLSYPLTPILCVAIKASIYTHIPVAPFYT
jgi:hypothetical protein